MNDHWIRIVERIRKIAEEALGAHGGFTQESALSYIKGLAGGLLSRTDAHVERGIDAAHVCKHGRTYSEVCELCSPGPGCASNERVPDANDDPLYDEAMQAYSAWRVTADGCAVIEDYTKGMAMGACWFGGFRAARKHGHAPVEDIPALALAAHELLRLKAIKDWLDMPVGDPYGVGLNIGRLKLDYKTNKPKAWAALAAALESAPKMDIPSWADGMERAAELCDEEANSAKELLASQSLKSHNSPRGINRIESIQDAAESLARTIRAFKREGPVESSAPKENIHE